MSPQPDHPDFTAAALGEGSPAELAAFAAWLAEDEVRRAESDALLETAGRLAAALRQEPARGFLTLEQRRAVLNPVAVPASVQAPEPAEAGAVPALPGHTRPAVRRRTARRPLPSRYGAWVASAGIAAALTVGIFILSSPDAPTGAGGTASSLKPKAGAGIPSIALDPAALADRNPGVPAPGMPALPQQEPALPPAPPPVTPLSPPTSPSPADAIVTTAPEIRLAPPPAPQPPDRTRGPEPSHQPIPRPHRAPDRGTLASPAPKGE